MSTLRPTDPGEPTRLASLGAENEGGKEVAALHRICHRQLHALFSETELAQRYSTVEALLNDEAVRTFVRWIRTKPNDFYERTRRSGRKG